VLDQLLLRWLTTPDGEAALLAAADAEPEEATFLQVSRQLERRFPERLARGAIEQAILRRRARRKFAHADRLFFLRDALEQATSDVVAEHRAHRFRGAPWIADLGCGIGGDTLALAAAGRVIAIDRDGLRLAVLQANARALGRSDSIHPVHADILSPPMRNPGADLAFADPSRRRGTRRTRFSGQSDPPLAALWRVLERFNGWGIKLSPALPRDEIPGTSEVEFVSVDGELKEAVLWGGDLRRGVRRATLLPQGISLDGETEPDVAVAPIEGFLLEPDPAVLRAGLVHTLAVRLDARLIDPSLSLLTSSADIDTPWARVSRVLEVLPAGLKTLRQALRARGLGEVTLKKRGSAVETGEYLRRLRLREGGAATVLLTRAAGRPVAVILEPRPRRT
jgi:SAM-dependent methyltransferase